MRPGVWILFSRYFFFAGFVAQQLSPLQEVADFFAAQPLMLTAKIAAMIVMRFFMGGCWVGFELPRGFAAAARAVLPFASADQGETLRAGTVDPVAERG